VQACHACIESAQSLIPSDQEHPHLVVCGVPDERRLHKCIAKLEKLGIGFKPFFEADLDGQLTAIATQPVYGEQRRHFKNYQLLKGE